MELVRNPLFARYFAWCGARNEERGGRELRGELLAGLAGRVLEVSAGSGLNFPHYPAAVREVVAVEPERYLRGRARVAAAAAAVRVRVGDGTSAELPAGDGEFDAVICSGLLCSVGNVPAALAEFRRVLRPERQTWRRSAGSSPSRRAAVSGSRRPRPSPPLHRESSVPPVRPPVQVGRRLSSR